MILFMLWLFNGYFGFICYALKYNLTMSANQVKLENQNQELKKEIQEVERVNGKEKRDIANLQQEVKELKEKLKGDQHD